MARETLPIDEHIPGIIASLEAHKNLVLVAEPGAGKTTRVPPALLAGGSGAREILLLQPRRLAARAAAQRICEENQWSLGQEVGYQIRYENRTSNATRIRVVTEGILSRRLQNDPELRGVSHVILDEFHERSLHSDLALSLLREAQQTFRNDLHIIVMSATLDADPVARFLDDCPLMRVPGRGHPIAIRHIERSLPLPGRPEFLDSLVDEIKRAIQSADRGPGHILVFLPGSGEIQRCLERLETFASQSGMVALALHGSLSMDLQDLALRPSAKPKIILATNIAETSLTIDGVNMVIDSGLARVMRYDSGTGLERLRLGRISQASAAQRAGRAGRQGPGVCVRLWTKFEDATLLDFDVPEIQRADLCESLLLLAQWGVTDPSRFGWFEMPPPLSLERSRAVLMRLGALLKTGELTALGSALLEWPVHPRQGRLLQAAVDAGRFIPEVATVAAGLSERDHRQMARSRDQLVSIARRASKSPSGVTVIQTQNADEFIERALLLAFSDRVCRRRRPGSSECRMVGGKGMELGRDVILGDSEFLLAIATRELDRNSEKRIFVEHASPIDRAWLEEYFPDRLSVLESVRLDDATGKVSAFSTRCYEDLPLEEPRPSAVSADIAFPLLTGAFAARWEATARDLPDVEQWLARLEFLRLHMPEMDWPVIRDDSVLALAELACYGEVDLARVLAKPLPPLLEGLLSEKQKSVFTREAPQSIVVPSGGNLKIHYSKDQGALLSVRLQEIFGWHESPKLANGRASLTFSLLGPNFRPVQITKDLKSFWEKGYQDVRKELRTRYPKHSWPENPWTARPEAKGRRR